MLRYRRPVGICNLSRSPMSSRDWAAIGPEDPAETAFPGPAYGRGEQLVDRCLHYLALAAASIGSVALIIAAAQAHGAWLVVSVIIYAASLLFMIAASALYNVAVPSRRKEWLRRLDHAAIFVMIAGTYTPFALISIGGDWGLSILAFVWLAAIGGVALKLLYPRRFEALSIVLYLLVGWVILVAIHPLVSAVSLATLILIGIGGVLYSGGIVFHLSTRLRYHNAIWHGFVLTAAACHYAAVLAGVVLAGPR
jgi:hemolysin III